ncbi:MAG: hypothetical protein H7249_16250, partial [Chitinophagaceae bacterium]|nr:hypothetical protein [Oligoflexus sp.]
LYPDAQGGLAARADQEASPIEKYDILLGHKQGELTADERNRTHEEASNHDLRRSLDQDWAAAAIFFAEPSPFKITVPDGKVLSFGAGDIKALLIRFVHMHSKADEGVETRSLGGTCHLDGDSFRHSLESRTLSPGIWNELKNDPCFKVNAAAFHLALTNLIGLRAESFILDPVTDQDLTYFPVRGFKSEVLGIPLSDSNAHQDMQIKTTVTYVLPSPPTAAKGSTSLATNTYTYHLEIDEAGEIISGTWNDEPSAPQLIWIQNRPRFTSDDAALEKLYTMSVSLPSRMAMRDFSAINTGFAAMPVRDSEALVVNKKYRLELNGDAPRGADGLKTFLQTAFRSLGAVSIYRNTFADEETFSSIEVEFHKPTTFNSVKQAIHAHSNGRSEVSRILR